MADAPKPFLQELNAVNPSIRTRDVLHDWLELSAKNIRNTTLPLVERHDLTVLNARYSEADHRAFQRMWEILNELFESRLDDHLGKLFMSLGHGDSSFGQFFTPYEISRLVASLNRDAMIETLAEKGYLHLAEPAVGSGGMLIAALDTIRNDDHGFNYEDTVLIEACDIDITCVYMAYIQLTIVGAAARITHGNTLSQEVRSIWDTPALAARTHPNHSTKQNEVSA